jgi:hypothetical protein
LNTERKWTSKSKKWTVVAIAVLMLLAATAVQAVGLGQTDSEGNVTGGPGGFAGTVLDYVTGAPIEGATVQVFNGTGDVKEGEVATLMDGTYSITTGVQGDFNDTFTYNLTYTAMNYTNYTVEGKTVSEGDTYYVNVSLVPEYSTVMGTVTDELTGGPLVMAMVILNETGMDQEQETYTDNNGSFSIQTMARQYTLKVFNTGYLNFEDAMPIDLPINSTDDREISLQREMATISGIVTGSGGLAGAEVALSGLVDDGAVTNETGWYGMNVFWGVYTLSIVYDGYYYHSEMVDLAPGENMVKDVAMTSTPDQTAEVFGYIKDNGTKLPIEGAMVCFMDTEGDGEKVCDSTGMDGYFYLGIFPAYFELQITAEGYKGHSAFVSISDEDSKNLGDIFLVTTPPLDKKLWGYVKEGVNPVAGATVTIEDVGSVLTNETGYYEIMVFEGTFEAYVEADGYFPLSVSGIAVSADVQKDFALTMVPALDNMLYGYVKDMDSKPISGATVSLIDVDPTHGGLTLETVTTPGGFYTFDIFSDEFLLIVDASGYNAHLEELNISDDKSLDIMLDDSGQEAYDTYITFDNWNNVSMKMEAEMGNDVMLLRYSMDADGDMDVSQAEVDAWLAIEKDKGPGMKDTEDMLYVDGVFYAMVDGTFDVMVEGGTGTIFNDDPVILTTMGDLISTEGIPAEVNHTISYNVTLDNAFADMSTELTVPEGWEARNITSEVVAVSGTFVVGMDPPMEKPGLTYEHVMLNVTGNSPPEADAGKNRTIKVATNETFDAIGSDDDFGIVNFTWDFGDGITDYGEEVVHNFTLPAGKDWWNYTVTLNVTDTAGVSGSTTIWVLVDGAPPTAMFVSNKTTTDEDGDDVNFNASQATDNVDIVNYTWDFDDGRFGYGLEVSHNWTQPGEYNVTLNVTDEAGWWANYTMVITVEDVTDPLAKITYLNSTPYFIEDVEYVTFNGSKSSDNVGVVSYSWDFDDGNTATGEEVDHTFAEGKFNVTLTVKDAAGNTNTSEIYVIEAKTKPKVPDLEVVKIWTEPDKFRDGDKVMIKVKIENKGDGDVDDFAVQFSYKNTKISVVRHQSVKAHDTVTVKLKNEWKAKEGEYKICGEADWENRIGETDENNNKKCTPKLDVGISWMNIGLIALLIAIVVVLVAVGSWRSRVKKREKKERLRKKKKR